MGCVRLKSRSWLTSAPSPARSFAERTATMATHDIDLGRVVEIRADIERVILMGGIANWQMHSFPYPQRS